MNPINLGILRHALTFVGGILITKGLSDAVQMGQLVSDIMTTAGTLISIEGVVGSIVSKFRQQRALQAAQSAPAAAPVISAAQ